MKKVFCFMLIMGLGFGCSGAPVKPGGLVEIKAPDWVLKGSGAFSKDGKPIFYGVGSASGIRNPALQRTTAGNRARNEIAKILETYTASLMKDYAASTTAGDMKNSSEEQHVEQAIKTVVSTTLNGAEIIDYWEHPTKDEVFALGKLDLENFKDSIGKARDLNSAVRDYVRKNAEKTHEDLSKEVEKMESKKQ